MILSSAMSPSAKVCDHAYDIPRLNRYFDFVSIMTYDYHGQWDKKTGHVAPIYSHPDDFEPTFNLNYTINYWLSKGMHRSKIIMGIPLYGQSFTLASRKDHGLNSKTYGGASAGKFTRARGFLSYYEICDKVRNKGWKVVRDPKETMGPYAYKNSEWVSFDDVDTIEKKMALLRKWKLGGAMVWALDLDDFNNQCGGGSYPLLKTINHGLGRLSKFKRPELLTTSLKRSSLDSEDEEEKEEEVDEVETELEQINQGGISGRVVSLPYQLYWAPQPSSWSQQPLTYNPKK